MKTLLTIWIKPVKTFKYLEKLDESKKSNLIYVLFFLTAMTSGLWSANDLILFLGINPYVGLFLAMIFSGLIGSLFYIFIVAPVILLSSRIFQGKGSINEIRLALAYSQVPILVLLVIGLISALLSFLVANSNMIIFENNITFYVLQLFSVSILIYGLSYFNKYSYIYAILTFIIPFALLQSGLYLLKFLIS